MANYQVSRNRKRHWLKAFIIVLIIGLVLAAGGIVTVRRLYQSELKPVSSQAHSVSFTIPVGYSLKQIAAKLHQQKLIKSSWAFEQYARNNNASDKIKAGTYDLSANQSVPEILSIITEGKIATNLITILPGKRLDQIKKSFVTFGFSQSEVDAAFNPELYKDHPALVDKPEGASLEGYLYPESFQKTTETKASTIVQQSLDEMQKRLTPEWRDAVVHQGLTVYQGIILASIVEQEVSRPADRAQVAQVFLKRLQSDMPLGSDVTAYYGAITSGQGMSLTADTPYNTLIHKGLPPGPISNVSESSLTAVAHPANTDWLYFVSGDDGVTYFSHTLAEHQALTAQHCKKLCMQTSQ